MFCRVDQSFDFLWLSMLRTFFAYYMTRSGRSLLRVILEIVWNFIWIANQSSFNNLSVLTLIWFNEILFTSALYLRHLPSQPSFSSLPYPTPSQIHNFFFLLLVVHTHMCDMYTYTYMWVYIYIPTWVLSPLTANWIGTMFFLVVVVFNSERWQSYDVLETNSCTESEPAYGTI